MTYKSSIDDEISFDKASHGMLNLQIQPRNQDSSRRTVSVEETASNVMVAINGAGFEWRYMADDEVPTNMALMAFLDSEGLLDVTSKGKDSEGKDVKSTIFNIAILVFGGPCVKTAWAQKKFVLLPNINTVCAIPVRVYGSNNCCFGSKEVELVPLCYSCTRLVSTTSWFKRMKETVTTVCDYMMINIASTTSLIHVSTA
nr:hypothetical protein [Tanacetum cinerariifolium]